MKTKSSYALVLSCLLSYMLTIPANNWAAPPLPEQRAGEVSRVIPAVNIARGSKSIVASAKTVVDWQDSVNTQANARARVSLDDGSVLNIGSDSSIRVVKHDAGAQQTELELSLGKVRSEAQKISKPNGKFEVHTPAGVAGVVGTDFYVSYENSLMTVIVFEGIVRVCNLAGVCVEVRAGQMATVRNNDPNGPATPSTTPPSLSAEVINSTTVVESSASGEPAHHIGKGTAITLGILAVIPAIVIPVVVSRGSQPSPQGTRCSPNQPGCVAP